MTLVIAHRGASAREYENSLAAFRRAVQDGADAVELDIHATADGELVVHHDPTVEGRAIRDCPAAVVRTWRLPNGEPLPSLAQALDVLGSATTAFIEVKALDGRHDAALQGVIASSPGPRRCHVHSFDHRIIRRMRAIQPAERLGILSCSYPIDPVGPLHDAGAGALWQDQGLLDRALVDALHSAGAKLHAWTVDDPARIRELATMGVDGICTNDPALAREIMG